MKLLSKNNIIQLFLIIFYLNLIGQDNLAHHRKYWWYKSRLNNDFVKVGVNAGESFPFNQRGINSSSFTNSSPNLKIGDGTSTLGLYIAQLATEYALLKKNQQNTDKVKHELFCALNAFDRVDYKAESIEQSGAYSLNGYFIRDDIPKNFARDNYNHFNYYNNWVDPTCTKYQIPNGDPCTFDQGDGGFHSKFNIAMFKTESSWSSRVDEGKTNTLYKESQDQAYNILFGLAFVNKFLGAGVSDNNIAFPYTGITELRAQARNQAQRIIDHIREPKNLSGNICNVSTWDQLVNSWIINIPTSCTEIPHDFINNNDEGGDARVYAYALGESECAITSNNYSAPATANLLGFPFACPNSGYHNVYSSTTGYTVWQNIAATNLYIPSDPSNGMDTRVFNTNLSAICNCVYGRVEDAIVANIVQVLTSNPVTNWLGVIINWVYHLVQATVYNFVPGFYKNITSSTVATNAYNSGAPIDHGPISHALLHGYQSYVANSQYSFDYLLDVVPCDGIYNFNNNQWGHIQWSSDNRCDHPNRIGQNTDFKGEYNGIDFMLYHNLYYLFQSGPFGINVNMTDLSDIYINQNNFNNSGNVNAYETITTDNTTINYTTPTAWRAGKTIYFGPGTSITGNNNLHAYIQKFDCATDYGAFRIANADSTSGNENNISNDSYAQGVKYHTVNYESEIQASYTDLNDNNNDQNLITELPVEEDLIEKIMKASYPEYSKELFVKPTVTIDKVRAYFTMDDNEEAFIHVLDLNGKIIISQSNIKSDDSGLTLDFTDFASGTYLLKFTTTKGTNKTQKIIKQ